jgi:hypothetical protein
MATMTELTAEYELLKATHQQLIDERATLQRASADGAAFQDLARRTQLYVGALDTYREKLRTRRHELALKKGPRRTRLDSARQGRV